MLKKLQSPGDFLTHLLNKYRLTIAEFAEDIGISQSMARQLTQDKTKITTSVAMRLAKYFNTVPEYWLVQQMRYDVVAAEKDKELARELRGISKVKKPSEKKPLRVKAEKKDTKKKDTKKKDTKKKTAKKKAPVTRKKAAKVKAPKAKIPKKAAKKKPAPALKRRKAGKVSRTKPAARAKSKKS